MRRAFNRFLVAAIRAGFKPGTTYLLTTRGRKTGRSYTTPVTLIEEDEQRWLVAPYGPVAWVHNARAAGEVTLTRGRRSQTVRVEELGVDESAPVLKRYVQQVRVVRPYFNAGADAPPEAYAAEAERHPVFRIIEPER